PENAYWISGETDDGEIVVTQAGRLYYWPETTLVEEAQAMFYGGRANPGPCIVKAADAAKITGVVFFGGAVWVRPDFRGLGLSKLMPRLRGAHAAPRWPIELGMLLVEPPVLGTGGAGGFGDKEQRRRRVVSGAP